MYFGARPAGFDIGQHSLKMVTVRGSTILSAHRSEMLPTRLDRDELRRVVPLDGTFRPDASNRAVYDRLYAEFPHLYRSQRRMFHRLNRPH